MINIKKNPYIQPTEVREEVVQAICDAFLGVGGDGSETDGCHIFSTQGLNYDEQPTIYVARHNSRSDYSCFRNEEQKREIERHSADMYTIFRIRGVEMKAAYEELQKAEYFMFGQMTTTGVSRYRCYCKSCLKGWGIQTAFREFID